jgi:hypothetical protein
MSESEIDYSNTIIYKITCKNTEITDKYVGHTIDFSKRKYAHMNNTNSERSPCYNLKLYKFIRDNGGWDNWKMDIVNFYNCANLREAKVKEQEHYIELQATLNSIEPLKIKDKITKICKVVSPVNKSESSLYCDYCHITCCKKSDLVRHEKTTKHLKMANYSDNYLSTVKDKLIEIKKQPDRSINNLIEYEKLHKSTKQFLCEHCDVICSRKNDWNRHILTAKHRKNMDLSVSLNSSLPKYNCKNCGYSCQDKYSWMKHINTKKHKSNLSTIPQIAKTEYTCEKCSKLYNKYNSYWAHTKKCSSLKPELSINLLINQLIADSKELRNFIIEHNNETVFDK